MKKSLYLLYSICFFFSIALIQGCEKEIDAHPQIQTLEVISISPGTALFKGNIVNAGDFKIIDYGFVFGSDPGINESNGIKVSLGKDAHEGAISKEVSGVYPNNYDSRVYVRAYITNENGTAYGQVISQVIPKPSASNISPTSGKVGDLITIMGNYFTTNKDDISVTFGNKVAKIVELTTTKVVVEIPSGIPGNQCEVYMTFKGLQRILVNYSFNLKPFVRDFSPKSGPIGTLITITGDNIPSYYYSNSVKILFGQTESYLSGYGNYNYQVYLPNNVTNEKLEISAVIDGVTTKLPGEFTVTPPTITSFSPTAILHGGLVTVNGSNFPTNYYNSTYTFKIGDVNVGLNSSTSNQFTFIVPTTIDAGDYPISLTVGPHTVTSAQKLTVRKHSVSSFSPSSAGIGGEVTLQGEFLPNQWYTVKFGNFTTQGMATSSSTLKVTVPYGADEGNVKITVEYGGQSSVAPGYFTVLAPSITSISPTSGNAGTVVTISGQGFNTSTWNTTVKFGTIQTNIISLSNNMIKAVVPSNVTPGSMKISVTTNGQTVTSTQDFTITN